MLNISQAPQSQQLFVASDSLFDNRGFIDLGNQTGWRFNSKVLLSGEYTVTNFFIELLLNQN
jgi:hypothetical protein